MPDPDPDDPLPALRAAIDQEVALAPIIAEAAAGYHSAFMAEGFQPREALYLTAVKLTDSPGKAP